jgi:hypothetical protein
MQAITINKTQQDKFKLFEDICKMERKRSVTARPQLQTPWVSEGHIVATDGRMMAWAPLTYFDLPENVTDGVIDIKKGVMLYKDGGIDNRPTWKRVIPEARELVGEYKLGGGKGTKLSNYGSNISSGVEIARLLLESRVPIDITFLQMVKADVMAYRAGRLTGREMLVLEAGPLNVLIMGFRWEQKDETEE